MYSQELAQVLKVKKQVGKIWCTHCNQWLIDSGTALDCPADGTFYICPGCSYRVVLFKISE